MTEAPSSQTRLVRGVFVFLALVGAIGIAAPSSAGLEQVHQVGSWKMDIPRNGTISDSTGSLILNPATRTGFQLFEMDNAEFFRLRIFDLDTLKTRFELPLGVRIYPARPLPAAYTHALDTDNNRLYLPFQGPPGNLWQGLIVIDGNTGKIVRRFERLQANDPTAVLTLDEEGNARPCTSASCQPQAFGGAPSLEAMDFVPSFIAGGLPKILMLWSEQNLPGVAQNANVSWLAQWDADTGRQDYAYRMAACQNRAMPSTTSSTLPLTVFQARIGAGIYLGCSASGGTGQVVRITLDTNGRPSTEESFPGPNNVADIVADVEDDRIIFRVVNEEGESYWVFNGQASAYSGVIGSTVAAAATALGVDPDNGRLYVMTPPTVAGRQSSVGGLLMSDIRRAPAPQGLAFPQFADKGFQRIAVDPRAAGGTRRLFVLPPSSRTFMILQDDVAITEDPQLNDLDRFTTDVDEQAGVTDVNFTSTGHAYGVRTLLTGGLEGVPPAGPDTNGVRIGRYAPRLFGSPCGAGDRVLVVGSVPQAQYSNNIFAARAIATETDAGSRTDVGEPTGRCWPYPRGFPVVSDPFFTVFRESFPRPLDGDQRHADDVEDATMPDGEEGTGRSDADELVGNDLPFGPAECSTEGEAKSKTTLQPIDRRGVPKEYRDTAQDMQGYRAEVFCTPSKGKVTALADAAAFEQTNIPGLGPDLTPGFIRVADVSSIVELFRDPKRGLVSRTTAYARGINISDRIFIDLAITRAEAAAAGRTGSAGTTFFRQLCGVRIPEAQIHGDYVDQDADPVHVGDPVDDATKPIDDPNDDTEIAGGDLGDVDPLDRDSDNVDVNGISQEFCGDPGVAQAGTQPVIDAINRVLGSRGKASSPSPDPELRQGSPGGYLASIQKDRLQQVGSRSVNQDDSTQVPALELIIFNDDPTLGRGRQIYQFAGVDSSVSYGIYLLNPDEVFEDFEGDLVDYTEPGFTEAYFPPPPPSYAAPAAPRARGPITFLFQSASILLRSPRDAVLGAAIWMILFAPFQMMSRRRALRRGV